VGGFRTPPRLILMRGAGAAIAPGWPGWPDWPDVDHVKSLTGKDFRLLVDLEEGFSSTTGAGAEARASSAFPDAGRRRSISAKSAAILASFSATTFSSSEYDGFFARAVARGAFFPPALGLAPADT
jgi:hypothetical protein